MENTKIKICINTEHEEQDNNTNECLPENASCEIKEIMCPIIACITAPVQISDKMRLKMAELIIKCKSFLPNFRGYGGYTPLMCCLTSDNALEDETRFKIAHMLINHCEFNPNIQDNVGNTALFWVIHTPVFKNNKIRLDIAKMIIAHPLFDPNIVNNYHQSALSTCLYSDGFSFDSDMRFSLFELLMNHYNIDSSV